MKRLPIASLAWVAAWASTALADTGVLIPGDRQQPDPAVFSLNEMVLGIRIDNGVARVQLRQVFGNHSSTVQEGVYQFALPGKATVSDFAVWDDVTRIPGVILERRRAGEIYEQAKAQAIDPGLLQMGERTADEGGGPGRPSQQFTARIVPIPRFGTKRIEMEYQHPIAVERYGSATFSAAGASAAPATTRMRCHSTTPQNRPPFSTTRLRSPRWSAPPIARRSRAI